MNSLEKIFNKNKNIIIGAIHFAPLVGYKDYPGYETVLKNALQDLEAMQGGGVDGVIFENNYDIPHKIFVEKETADLIERLARELKNKAKVPVGFSILWNDYKTALQIAKNVGAEFIRVPVFVDSVKTSYGKVYADAKAVLEYRDKMGAKDVALFTDIHVKHAEMLESRSIEESAKFAIEQGSNALIVTGKWSGDAPDLDELKSVKEAVGDFPILVGSGIDGSSVRILMEYAKGAIVGTSLKEGGKNKKEVNITSWYQRVSKEKVKDLISKINR